MRRTLLMIMAVALLLTQCRKPEVKFPTPSSAEGVTVSMTVTAGPGGKTDISETGAITWSEGDKLYVGFGGKYVGYLTLTSGQNTPTGWFSGNVTLPKGTTGENTFGFFYLGNAKDYSTELASHNTYVDVSFATQEIYADANNKLVNASAHHVGYGSAKGTVAGSEVTGINVTLVSKVALARFSFKMSGTPASPYTGALTLSGDHIYNSMKVNFGGTFTGEKTGGGKISLTNTTTSEKYVMLVPPATAVKETLEFGGEYEGDTELAQGIEANKYYGQGEPIEVVLTKAPVSVTGVSLNKNSLSLEVGDYETLTATVAPDDATNKDVAWESDKTGVATVDGNGKVTAVAVGEATITVTTVDCGKTAQCAVTVTPAHEYVDLGLPSGRLWATCNVGADSPEGYGWYFMWGSTTNGGDPDCTWANCPGNGGSSDYNETAFNTWKTTNLTGDVLKPEVDAAHVNWGGGWRMPTSADWEELYANTNAKRGSVNGVSGWNFVNKADIGKSIFIPHAGYLEGTGVMGSGESYYWSGSLDAVNPVMAECWWAEYMDIWGVWGHGRCDGLSVRPVR